MNGSGGGAWTVITGTGTGSGSGGLHDEQSYVAEWKPVVRRMVLIEVVVEVEVESSIVGASNPSSIFPFRC